MIIKTWMNGWLNEKNGCLNVYGKKGVSILKNKTKYHAQQYKKNSTGW